MLDKSYSALLVAVIAITSLLIKFLPFVIFKDENKTPKWVTYLGKVLPPALIGMLVVYCLRQVSFTASPYGLPEIVSCLAVALIWLLTKKSVPSILGGTVLYMFLIQGVIL